MKKFFVLGILFILPLTAYMFFASGVNNFAKLPILTNGIKEISDFKDLSGKPVKLQDHITVLGFFGNDPFSKNANAFNMAHKVYKKNFQFEDFQFIILIPEGAEASAEKLKGELAQIEKTDRWKFATGPPEAISEVFESLESNFNLDTDLSTPFVFIIDKDRNLRGRKDDDDVGVLYGFNSGNYSEINNKMGDDVKVLLAEYRLALKKYNKSKRDI